MDNRCINCGGGIQEGDVFCPFCGHKVDTAVSQPQDAVYCTECGAANSVGDLFCYSCGAKLEVDDGDTVEDVDPYDPLTPDTRYDEEVGTNGDIPSVIVHFPSPSPKPTAEPVPKSNPFMKKPDDL